MINFPNHIEIKSMSTKPLKPAASYADGLFYRYLSQFADKDVSAKSQCFLCNTIFKKEVLVYGIPYYGLELIFYPESNLYIPVFLSANGDDSLFYPMKKEKLENILRDTRPFSETP